LFHVSRAFCSRFSFESFERLPKEVGIGPEKLFDDIDIVCSSEALPMDDGI
jgi:hypothetical protein